MRQSTSEEIHSLRWAWQITDPRLIERLDLSIAKRFSELSYHCIPGDRYLKIHGYSPVPKRDMMTAFIGSEGAFLLCVGCADEPRGLHMHITCYGNPPDPQSKVYQDMRRVNDAAKRSVMLISRIEEGQQALGTGWPKLVAAVILSGGSLAGLRMKPFLEGSALHPVLDTMFAIVLFMSLLYVVFSIGLSLVRAFLLMVMR